MKIAATPHATWQPPLCYGKKEGGISPPPTPHPTITHVKYVRTVSILYWLGVGEGGAG